MPLSYLQHILCRDRNCGTGTSCSKLILKELIGTPKLKRIEIMGVSGQVFLYKIDCPKIIQILDNTVRDINKTCDYALFYIKNNKLCATLCELKSGSPKQKDYFYQLAITEIIVNALFEIVKMKKVMNKGKIRKILFCTNYPKARLSKNGVYGKNNVHYDNIKIDNCDLSFNVIVCRDNDQFHINRLT